MKAPLFTLCSTRCSISYIHPYKPSASSYLWLTYRNLSLSEFMNFKVVGKQFLVVKGKTNFSCPIHSGSDGLYKQCIFFVFQAKPHLPFFGVLGSPKIDYSKKIGYPGGPSLVLEGKWKAYWVGSLEFSFLVEIKLKFSTNPPQKKQM